VPEKSLGVYFSKRTSIMQALNVVLSIAVAFLLDYIKQNKRGYQLSTYSVMFASAGVFGIIGVFILAKAPEPLSTIRYENIFKMLIKPLKDKNFLRLLVFNSAWVFAVNLATPFFTVYLIKQ